MPAQEQSKQAFFYGWYIVGVGFLSYLVCSFNLSSTLSVFVKPLTEDFGVSRGMFSLLRTGEILIGGVLAPLIGPLVDRYSGRWLMAIGALAAGAGFLFLSQAKEFWHPPCQPTSPTNILKQPTCLFPPKGVFSHLSGSFLFA